MRARYTQKSQRKHSGKYAEARKLPGAARKPELRKCSAKELRKHAETASTTEIQAQDMPFN